MYNNNVSEMELEVRKVVSDLNKSIKDTNYNEDYYLEFLFERKENAFFVFLGDFLLWCHADGIKDFKNNVPIRKQILSGLKYMKEVVNTSIENIKWS